jgi:hypothetical protein
LQAEVLKLTSFMRRISALMHGFGSGVEIVVVERVVDLTDVLVVDVHDSQSAGQTERVICMWQNLASPEQRASSGIPLHNAVVVVRVFVAVAVVAV